MYPAAQAQTGAPVPSEHVPFELHCAWAVRTQVAPHAAEPDAQAQAKVPVVPTELQIAAPPPDVRHGVHDVPHEFTSLFGRHCMPHRWNPELQAKSQVAPAQTGDAFAGVVQAAHAP